MAVSFRPSRAFPSHEDARELARQRLPRVVFDFIDGGAGQEAGMARNRRAFDEVLLMPRILRDMTRQSLSRPLMGRDYALPFGIAPMGLCDLAWPGTDQSFAAQAAKSGIPVCVSTASSTALEDMHRHSQGQAWLQLYVSGSTEAAMTLVNRAAAAGYQNLILTVDVPKLGRRPRDVRNGFKTPFRITPRGFFDFALHPQWSLQTLLTGIPRMANFDGSPQAGYDRQAVRAGADWAFLDRLRDAWRGRLIVKGVLSSPDAVRLREAGVDAIWVSNHGGRQLESAPASLAGLVAIREAVGTEFPLILDGGIRSGEDVVKALALGATFTMLGRPFLFASAANGARGVDQFVQSLTDEISTTLAQIGVNALDELGPGVFA